MIIGLNFIHRGEAELRTTCDTKNRIKIKLNKRNCNKSPQFPEQNYLQGLKLTRSFLNARTKQNFNKFLYGELSRQKQSDRQKSKLAENFRFSKTGLDWNRTPVLCRLKATNSWALSSLVCKKNRSLPDSNSKPLPYQAVLLPLRQIRQVVD